MKSNFGNGIGKKVVAVLLLLSMTAGIVFSAPLAVISGDAKIYDSTYKSVKNASEASDGYVIKTGAEGVLLENGDVKLSVEPNSLAQIISLDGNPEIYLLDGRAELSSASAFTIRTTVTSYKAEAGTSIYVITEEKEETAYVGTGSATATNLITKEVTQIGAGTYIDNAKAGFTPAQTVLEEYWKKPSQTQQAAQQPAAEAPSSEAAQQPAAQQPAAEAPSSETAQQQASTETAGALVHTFDYYGFTATVEAYIGQAYISYPAFVTDEELGAAAAAAVAAYPEYTQGITYEILEPGLAVVYYPEAYGPDEFNFAMGLLEGELYAYLDYISAQLFASVPETEPEPVVTEQPAETPAAETAGALVHTFDYYGFTATVEAYIGQAYISYPAFVTDEELGAAAAAAVAAYPEYTQGITYEILEPGLAVVYYPEAYGPEEFYFAMGLLEGELYAYLDYISAQLFAKEPAPAPAAPEVKQEEPAVVEQPAPEQTAPEKTPIETAPRPEEPAPEAPVEKKASDFRFGAALGFVYGFGEDGDEYADPAFLKDRVGVFKKNFTGIINPYFSYKNFQFGLHFVLNVKNGQFVNPFTFDTEHGVTGYIGSVMKYVSLFSFKTDDGSFNINVSRNNDLDFRSPINEPFRLGFDKEDKLLATMTLQAGGFSIKAFADDLELTAKRNGRSQYAGVRAAYKLNKFEIGLSAIADIKGGVKEPVFYPGADIVVPLHFGNQDLEISAEGAAQIKSGKIRAILAKAMVNTITDNWFVLGFGAAYNHRSHINEIMNNGPADVIEQFSGKSIDVILKTGVQTGPFSLIGKFTLPLSLTKGQRLAYNTVITKSGKEAYISADTMDIQMDLSLGAFRFSAGVIYNGFSGRVGDVIKALAKREGRRKALVALLDPEVSTYYALATVGFNAGPTLLQAFVRADLMRVSGTLTVPVSAGIGITF
ncbi:MAG: hypothetical protein II813_05920 [Spirochaetales bacterium]|nr:hypothetical protein [Spirochaetales bacterium]